jgi:hypothetical protein
MIVLNDCHARLRLNNEKVVLRVTSPPDCNSALSKKINLKQGVILS